MAEEENKIILYTTDDGRSQVSLMSRDGGICLNKKQMAAFAVSGGRATALPRSVIAPYPVGVLPTRGQRSPYTAI